MRVKLFDDNFVFNIIRLYNTLQETSYLPWIMKLFQGPIKFVIGCWTHSGTSSFTPKKECQSDHEVWGPQKCGGRRKRGILIEKGRQGPRVERWCHGFFIMNFFGEEKRKTREDKRMVKFDFFAKTILLGHILRNSAHILSVHGHSSWSTFGLDLVRDSKALSIDFLRNQTMNCRPSSRTMKKGHLPWSNFMIDGV